MSGHTPEQVEKAAQLFEHLQQARAAGKDWWVDVLERVIVREVDRDQIISDLAKALSALTAALVELRDEQTSENIFGGQTTKERRASSEIYAARIREAADKLLSLIDDAEAAIARATAHTGEG